MRSATGEIGEEEEDGAGGDLLRDDLRGLPLLAVHGQGPRLDRPPPGREGKVTTAPIGSPSPSEHPLLLCICRLWIPLSVHLIRSESSVYVIRCY